MINLRDKAFELCENFKANGFNSIIFHKSYVEDDTYNDFYDPDNPNMSEMSPSQYQDWRRDYACFIAEYDTSRYDLRADGKYLETTFNESQLINDLIAFVTKEVGPDVLVEFNKRTCEFEVYRKAKFH